MSGLHIVVTGSSAGIGQALVERLLAHGHYVWGLARSSQGAPAGTPADRFQSSRCDVGDWAAVSAAAATVAGRWPRVDALVTCAGSQGEMGRAVAADPAAWSATIRGNLDATFYSIRAFHALMGRGPSRAKIVCFSGGGASKARPNFTAYAAAKTAIVRLVETIAEEERATALDINALAPGAINTRLTEEVIAKGPEVVGPAEHAAAVKQKANGGGSMGKALDAVEWLLSPASDGISGRLLSAPWDPLPQLPVLLAGAPRPDIYQLRRVTPDDLGLKWPPP